MNYSPRGMQVTIRGVVYPCVKDAAFALGVSASRLYNLRSEGRIDSVGLLKKTGRKSGPVTIRNFTYSSKRLAALQLGVTVSAINKAVQRNKLDALGLRAPRRSKDRLNG